MSANYGYSCIALFQFSPFVFWFFFCKSWCGGKKINPVNLSGVLHTAPGI
jgi:hypothetical protein